MLVVQVQVQGSGDTIALYHQHAGVGSESMGGRCREGAARRRGRSGDGGVCVGVGEGED